MPLFVYFRAFLNTMTILVQNLTITIKSIDGVSLEFEPMTTEC